MNRVQFQEGLSLHQFIVLYGTEENCEASLEQASWTDGFRCPRCDAQQYGLIRGRLMINGLDQGQKRLPRKVCLHFLQEWLAACSLLGVCLLVVRKAQLERGRHYDQSQSWIWMDFSGFVKRFPNSSAIS
jgi:hypothetical protein